MPLRPEFIKRIVLERSHGFCELCDNPLGDNPYFHRRNSRLTPTPSNVKVVCSKCHRKIVASRRRIY